jgi:GT2 family glycosyltransferase
VIVTYNRQQLLAQVLEAVLGQTLELDEIIVINNNSADGTTEYLLRMEKDLPNLYQIALKGNEGGAGGFYHGIKEAYVRKADWIWVMDDDAIPEPDALEALVESEVFKYYNSGMKDPLGFLASRVDWKNGYICKMNIPKVAMDWNQLHCKFPCCIKVKSASFVSILINREAVKRVGYPVKEFFIWFDDVEYTLRISKQMPAYYIPSSVAIHHTEMNVRPMDFENLDKNNLWKFKYGIRNEVATLCNEELGFIRGLLFIVAKMFEMFRCKKSISIIVPMLSAGLQGLFFRYVKLIEFPNN